MAKLNAKKQSKRQPARQRYKIQKKIREHNRKVRREAKKNPKKTKHEIIQVPNICPFKEDILREAEAIKKHKEEERQKAREQARLEKQHQNATDKKTQHSNGLAGLVANAEIRNKLHDHLNINETSKTFDINKEQSLKAYYKEFRKVIEAADVVLEVVDARDPLGTRCLQVEQAIKDLPGNKRLVIVLNKSDLVPKEILNKWLKYLRKTAAAIPFKASTQNQSRKLAQRKLPKSDKGMQVSACVGAELLISLLANYCRNKGIKTSIRVGIVGLPNVGKSSIINSLKRSRACSVGATPGVTRAMQEVQLDSKIKLLDSPGIVFASGSDSSASLRNAVRVATLSDPITPANAILQRVGKQQMMELYDITEYSSPEEFYSLKASRYGKFKKGGVPDAVAAARGLLEDWNSGKIKYYTVPPEDTTEVHVSASIVSEEAKEFHIDDFESMEHEVIDSIGKQTKGDDKKMFEMESLGPVTMDVEMEVDNSDQLLSENIAIQATDKKKKSKGAAAEKKNPEMQLEGNLKLNQIKKQQFKKEKKLKNRKEKIELQVAESVENEGNYDFDTDFQN